MTIKKESLQSKIRKLSEEKEVSINTFLQNYFFEAFLKRLVKSDYSDNFVFKGGFLLSTSLGIDNRATMDIDFLLKNISLEKENIKRIFMKILSINVDDNITFEFIGIEDIRQDDFYGGFNVSLLGHLENIKVPVSIDIATGDPITPNVVIYKYKCLFDGEELSLPSYNYETVVAEKLQTVFTRALTNSRCKDFYDLYIIYKLRWNEINVETLREAYKNTCEYRQTAFTFDNAVSIIDDISDDKKMYDRWLAYQKKNSYAKEVEFIDTINAVRKIVDIIYHR